MWERGQAFRGGWERGQPIIRGREMEPESTFVFLHTQSCHFNGFQRRRQTYSPGSLGNQLHMEEAFFKTLNSGILLINYCFRAFFFLISISYTSDFFFLLNLI